MSWLFKSLRSDDPEDFTSSSPPDQSPRGSPTNRPGGVKEDLSVVRESIGRQLRGFASFLAPPPNGDDKSQLSDFVSSSTSSPSPSQALLGVRNDLAEIGGSLKSGLSLLCSNRAVAEISKLTSSLLQFQSNDNQGRDDDNDYYDYEDGNDYTPGITDEVLNFVKEISLRPECWTDFPLSLETDFKMSDAQKEHASTVEHMVPSFKALRDNLHRYIGDEHFWLIYFILVLPRMNEEDNEILSSPEIVETRSRLLQKLQKTRDMEVETSEDTVASDASQQDTSFEEQEVTETANEIGRLGTDDEEKKRLKEAEIDQGTGKKKLEHEDDVSFSDLEDDENDLSSRMSGSGKVHRIVRTPWPSGSSDWVQLNESCETQGKVQKARASISHEKDSDAESNDWLKVDDFD